jgi:hypothetical protein
MLVLFNWGEPERAPQFGGSSSSSAMHYGALYVVRTYTELFLQWFKSYRPFAFAPAILRTFSPAVIYSKFYRPFASHQLTIFHATCDEIYSSCQITNGNWNGQYYLQWSVLLSPSQFYFTRFLSELRIKFWCKARFRFDLGSIFCNSSLRLWKKDLVCKFLQPAPYLYVLNVLFTCTASVCICYF